MIVGFGISTFYFYYGFNNSATLFEETKAKKADDIMIEIYTENEVEKAKGHGQKKSSDISRMERIARISMSELSEQISAAKEKIAKEDLINKLNSGTASQRGLEEAKILLESVALMSLERAHRQLREQEPQLERGFENIEQELSGIRDLLEGKH